MGCMYLNAGDIMIVDLDDGMYDGHIVLGQAEVVEVHNLLELNT